MFLCSSGKARGSGVSTEGIVSSDQILGFYPQLKIGANWIYQLFYTDM